jgi:hypothetical protein
MVEIAVEQFLDPVGIESAPHLSRRRGQRAIGSGDILSAGLTTRNLIEKLSARCGAAVSEEKVSAGPD